MSVVLTLHEVITTVSIRRSSVVCRIVILSKLLIHVCFRLSEKFVAKIRISCDIYKQNDLQTQTQTQTQTKLKPNLNL